MIQDTITYLNTRLESLGYFNEILGLAERIEKATLVYPAIYSNGEYNQINLDSAGSLSYWRKNGDLSYSEQPSTTKIGQEYIATLPLRFVGFMFKEDSLDDPYFAYNVAQTVIGTLTNNSVALKQSLKALRVNVSATKTSLDGRLLALEEYEKIDFEPRYNWAYLSIDFKVEIVTNQNCFDTLCNTIPTEFHCGVVRILNEAGELITEVDCGDSYTVTETCEDATVHNSDDTYEVTVASGGDLELEDITFNVYVNGVFNQTFDTPSMVDNTININN